MAFDLDRFRNLAFWRPALPDHPMRELADARKLLAQLPADDPEAALAELTHWAATLNATQTFTAGRRARLLIALDEATRPLWRALSHGYLAPNGKPAARGGDQQVLRALFDSASEFANGFAIVLDRTDGASESGWVEKNLASLFVRNMRWLGRRLTLSHMLHLSAVGAIWERLHRLHQLSEVRGVARAPIALTESERFPTSVRQEYLRALLLELAAPESLTGRQVELAYRITGRVASAAALSSARSDTTAFAVVPAGDARPGPAERFGPNIQPSALFIDTVNCLPRLRAMRERDMDRDPADPDTLFGEEYALRERFAMLERLIAHWGMDAPRRRARRIPMASAARVVSGFDGVLAVVPLLHRQEAAHARSGHTDLQLALDDTSRSLRRSQLRAGRAGPARVIDASNGGLGLALKRVDAPWAKHGALLGIVIEPNTHWMVGVLRRIFAIEDELRLGVQILSVQPRQVSFSVETGKTDSTWEEAMKFEATFRERYKQAILLEPMDVPLEPGEMLLPPGLGTRNSQFDMRLAIGVQRVRITRIHDENEYYQRAAFEPLALGKVRA